MGLLILLVGLLNFFHFLVGSYFNRVREFSLMKVNGCKDWQLFCLLLTQSLLVTLAASLLMLCGIELSAGRMDYSLQFFLHDFRQGFAIGTGSAIYLFADSSVCCYLLGFYDTYTAYDNTDWFEG